MFVSLVVGVQCHAKPVLCGWLIPTTGCTSYSISHSFLEFRGRGDVNREAGFAQTKTLEARTVKDNPLQVLSSLAIVLYSPQKTKATKDPPPRKKGNVPETGLTGLVT